jgi:hypothetical protein
MGHTEMGRQRGQGVSERGGCAGGAEDISVCEHVIANL